MTATYDAVLFDLDGVLTSTAPTPGLEGDGHREPEHRDEAGDVAGLARGLGDHRVDEHHEQRAGGEAVDGRLEVAGGGVGDRVADDRRQRADDGDGDPQPADRRRAGVPAARISLAEPIASGRFETKIATSRPTLTPSPDARPMPSTICSGMPSRKAPSASAGAAAGRPTLRRAAEAVERRSR